MHAAAFLCPASCLRLWHWHIECSRYKEDWYSPGCRGCTGCVGVQVACSIASGQFGEDKEVYYVLGTAYLNPDELEPGRVRCNRPCPSKDCLVLGVYRVHPRGPAAVHAESSCSTSVVDCLGTGRVCGKTVAHT